MNKPVLVVMAAGMGSRYGGMKQIDPIGNNGELIIDYSIYDAKKAGFETVIFIIKRENEELFKSAIGNRISKHINVHYAYQELNNLPQGFAVPSERQKPWGTAHAVLSAKNIINGPFAVINADDFYGAKAFSLIYEYLLNNPDTDNSYNYAMVGYILKNTVTENGHVARGVCQTNENGYLSEIIERTHIEKRQNGIEFTLDDGKTWQNISENAIVSMNMWGFTNSFLAETNERFAAFLQNELPKNPLKCEYFLPSVVDMLLNEKKAVCMVLKSSDKWYGVTYKEDKPYVVNAIQQKIKNNEYPDNLWK